MDKPCSKEEWQSLLESFLFLYVNGLLTAKHLKVDERLTEEICYQIDNEVRFRQFLIKNNKMEFGGNV